MIGPTLLAFQVWDACGWLGQGVFTWRMLHQWWASERARRSVLPASFWWWSLAGTLPLLVYALHRGDGVFTAGALINGALYVRNLWLMRGGAPRPGEAAPDAAPAAVAPPAPRPGVLGPLAGALALFAALLVLGLGAGQEVVGRRAPPLGLALGFLGQAVWSSRFVLQWWISERQGRSVLPPSFFVLSIVGAVLLCAYAVLRLDYVMMTAYALNPLPYVRNLVLLRRGRASRGG